MKHWLLIIENDVEPKIWGPYDRDTIRLKAARQFRARRGPEHGLFRLDAETKPNVDAFMAAEMKLPDEPLVVTGQGTSQQEHHG